MAHRVKLNPENPHAKRIFEAADMIRSGSVALIPTDSQYALACDYENKKGIERIREMRELGRDDHLSLLCDSLTGVATFAHINDENFKLIKRLIPGPYTLILPATKKVPKLLVHPKKKTVGIRVPDYPICTGVGREVGRPLLVITAKKPEMNNDSLQNFEREPFLREFEKLVDITIDNQQDLPARETTIIDFTNAQPHLLRRGLGIDRARQIFARAGVEVEDENP